ncbi:MAG: outer membrane beta-barrel protein [Acidobacteriota bacterium]|nr:outer membrane beta-barrel protein [Acidobacteriota bacterium]MDQ7086578.1 outer membrane beta-barrel protein [Acidobacteriota bacterium]
MIRRHLLFALVLLACASAPALALGPVDGEFGVIYWLSDTDITVAGDTGSWDSEDIGFHGQLWLAKWGLRAGVYKTDLDIGNGAQITYSHLDVQRKLFAPTENNFFALGLGWQQVKIDTDLSNTASGLRLSAEARIGLVGVIYLYGDGAYYISLGDFDTELTNPEGWEVEVGISYKPAPFINFRAGYRAHTLDVDTPDLGPGTGGSIEPSGLILGASVNF